MKKIIMILGIISIFLFSAFLVNLMNDKKHKDCTKHEVLTTGYTSLCVINYTQDSVLTYLTLGSVGDTNYVQTTNGIFGIKLNGTQNSFWLAPNDTICYQSPNTKGFNGNITFGVPPQNCADTVYNPTGINLFEFNLNDNFVVNAQETIDISCVSGVNSYIAVRMVDGGKWNNGTDTIKSFFNGKIYENYDMSGVFPFGCDSCVGITKRTPYCSGHKQYAKPQSKNLCNIQRNAKSIGGVVLVQFNGFIK